jgi:hypothetical protein
MTKEYRKMATSTMSAASAIRKFCQNCSKKVVTFVHLHGATQGTSCRNNVACELESIEDTAGTLGCADDVRFHVRLAP